MNRIAFVGLVAIDFPGYDLRLCDGGFIEWGGDTYRSKDGTFGVIGSVQALNEGVGEEVPVFELTLLPSGDADISDLSQPGYQSSRCRFYLGEYDADTGLLVGDPDLQFDGHIDQTTLEFGRDTLTLQMNVVSNTARLIERNIGNSMNSTFHKSIWAGETGHDNATGLGKQIAWGVESPVGRGGNNQALSGTPDISRWQGQYF